MKLEVGNYYRTRDGRKVGPMVRVPKNSWFGKSYVWAYDWNGGATPAENLFCEHGNYWETGAHSENDLIAEWTDTHTIGTLADIGAQVGDVVEWVSEDETIVVTELPKKRGVHDDHYQIKHDDGGYGLIDPRWGDFRIVSRAPDLSKLNYTPINVEKPIHEIEHDARPLEYFQSGPVITETMKRIVPGVYGKVSVHEWGVGSGELHVALINNYCDKEWVIHAKLSRADLIAARDVFNQLIEAMEE